MLSMLSPPTDCSRLPHVARVTELNRFLVPRKPPSPPPHLTAAAAAPKGSPHDTLTSSCLSRPLQSHAHPLSPIPPHTPRRIIHLRFFIISCIAQNSDPHRLTPPFLQPGHQVSSQKRCLSPSKSYHRAPYTPICDRREIAPTVFTARPSPPAAVPTAPAAPAVPAAAVVLTPPPPVTRMLTDPEVPASPLALLCR